MHKKGDYYNWLMQKEKTWYDERLYRDSQNQFQSAGSNIEITRKDFDDDDRLQLDLESAQQINNQVNKGFNEILEKIIQNPPKDLKQKVQNQSNKNDESSCKMQSVASSSSRILQQCKTTSSSQRFEKDILSLKIDLKGEGFSYFKLLKIDIRVKCKQCGQFSESKIVDKQEPDLFYFESKCSECNLQKITFQFKKVIQKIQGSLWQIGQLKFSRNVEIVVKNISISPVCNCQATPQAQRLPKIDIKCEEKILNATKQFKCEQIEKQRYFCFGCCKEITLVPEWVFQK